MVVPSTPFGRGAGALHQCLFGSAASYLIYADVRIHIPMTHRNDRLRDQFVVQLSGSKHWVLCSHDSPPEGLTLSTEMFVGKTGTLSQADIAALRDLRRRSSISALSDPAAGGEGGGDGGGDGSDQLAPPWTGYEESVYKDVSYERGELTCFNVVASAGDRLYIPAGMLYRASAVGDQISAHLSISLHRLGVTWGDLIVASMGTVRHDLQAAAAAAAPAEEEEEEEEGGGGGGGSGGASIAKSTPQVNLWEPPGRGFGWRSRTSVPVGQCTRGECNEIDMLVFRCLRASATTNGPRALTAQSALLTQMIPMWEVKRFRAMLHEEREEDDNGVIDGFLPAIEASAFFKEFQWFVRNPLIAQLVAVSETGTDELEGEGRVLTLLLSKLQLSAALGMAMLQLEIVPDFTVNEKECRQF